MEENKPGEIKTRIYDMSGLRLCLYGLIITVINISIQGFDIFLQTTGVTFSAGIIPYATCQRQFRK